MSDNQHDSILRMMDGLNVIQRSRMESNIKTVRMGLGGLVVFVRQHRETCDRTECVMSNLCDQAMAALQQYGMGYLAVHFAEAIMALAASDYVPLDPDFGIAEAAEEFLRRENGNG